METDYSVVMWIAGIVIGIEVYYWFWWFPRNWRKNRQCRDLVLSVRELYGKDGLVTQQVRKGRL